MTDKQRAAALRIRAELAKMTTEQLLGAVVVLDKDTRFEAQKVLSYALDELADRLIDDDFIELVESLSYGQN